MDLMPNVVSRLMIGAAVDGFELYEDMVAGYPKTPIEDQMAGQDMLYSSGTTGRPKAIKTSALWRSHRCSQNVNRPLRL